MTLTSQENTFAPKVNVAILDAHRFYPNRTLFMRIFSRISQLYNDVVFKTIIGDIVVSR